MRFFSLLLFSVFVTFSSGSTSFVLVGPAIADPVSDNNRPCHTFTTDVVVNTDKGPDMLREVCQNGTLNGRNGPVTDEEAYILSMMAMVLSGVKYEGSEFYRKGLVEIVQHVANDNAQKSSHIREATASQRLQKAMKTSNFEDLWTSDWERFRAYLRIIVKGRSIFEILGISHEVLYDTFKVENNNGRILPSGIFSFQPSCKNQRIFQMKVCFLESTSRIRGTLTETAPKGIIVKDEFRYYDVPQFAIMTKKGPVSVENCSIIDGVQKCFLMTDECNIVNYTLCNFEKHLLYADSFVKNLHNTLFVASDLQSFGIWNGTHTIVEHIPSTKQMLMKIPKNWVITLGKRVLMGNYSGNFEIIPVFPEERLVRDAQQQMPLKATAEAPTPSEQLALQLHNLTHQIDGESRILVFNPQAQQHMWWHLWEFVKVDIPRYVRWACFTIVAYAVFSFVYRIIFIINNANRILDKISGWCRLRKGQPAQLPQTIPLQRANNRNRNHNNSDDSDSN